MRVSLVGKPSAALGLRNLAQAVTFSVIEVLAIQELDGWVAWALALIVAWNVLNVLLMLLGVFTAAALHMREGERLGPGKS